MSHHKPLFLTTLLASAVLLSACGGGSGGDEKPRKVGDETTPPITDSYFGASGEFRNLDREPNNLLEDESVTELDDLTNLKGQVNTQTDEYDAYHFKLTKSGTYQLTLTGFGGNDLDLFVGDTRKDDLLFLGDNAPGQDEVAKLDLEANVDYVVIVRASDTAGQTSDYRLMIEKEGAAVGGSGGGRREMGPVVNRVLVKQNRTTRALKPTPYPSTPKSAATSTPPRIQWITF